MKNTSNFYQTETREDPKKDEDTTTSTTFNANQYKEAISETKSAPQ